MNLLQKLGNFTVQELLKCPKIILSKEPANGLKEEYQQLRAELELEAEDGDARFRMFIRKHKMFESNFSIGLDFRGKMGSVPLIRYNGPHKTTKEVVSDAHFNYHIHTEADLESTKSYMSKTEVTNKYSNYKDALYHAFEDLNIQNYGKFFPDEAQTNLFED